MSRLRASPDIAKLRVVVKRDCEACGKEFEKQRMGQRVCSPKCAARHVRIETAKRKEATKTLNDWIADAQKEFNGYIRARDEAAGHPCICCGKFGGEWSRGGIWDCGHYRSRGSAGHLRFDERNAHRQLKQCNSYGGGRHVDYRIGLIARIGLEAVETLEADQGVHKWTVEELKAIKAKYKAKLKALKASENET